MIATLFAGVVFVNSTELGVIKQQGAVTKHTIEVQEQITSLKTLQARRDLVVRNRAESLGFIRPLTPDLHFLDARTPLAGP